MRDGSLHRFSWLFLSGAAAVMFDQQLEQFFLQRGRSQFSHEAFTGSVSLGTANRGLNCQGFYPLVVR